MLLVVDVGNTQSHVGLFDSEDLLEHWRFHTSRTATADELAVSVTALLRLRDLGLADIEALSVSCVVPALAQEYDQLIARYLEGRGALVGPGDPHGHAHQDRQPTRAGGRQAGERGGGFRPRRRSLHRSGLRHRRELRRGLPLRGVPGRRDRAGIEISLEALSQRAAALPRIRLEAPESAIGRGTLSAIQSGVIYGYAGQVDGLVGRIREELGEEAPTIATGGFAAIIAPHCELIDEVDDLLTLTGLRLVWERNRD